MMQVIDNQYKESKNEYSTRMSIKETSDVARKLHRLFLFDESQSNFAWDNMIQENNQEIIMRVLGILPY